MTLIQNVITAFPPSIWIMFMISAVMCCIGFYKFIYFLSIGYGFAIMGIGMTILILFTYHGMNAWVFLQCCLLILYGLRLGGFLLIRELKSKDYRKTLAEATKREKSMPIFVKIIIWVIVSALYIAQISPVYYRLVNGRGMDIAMPVAGVIIMALALIIETVADMQKATAKKLNPNIFCKTGLYRIVRCPNYFGELLFWTGVFVSGFGAMTSIGQWIVACIGYLAIIYIMFSGAKRLETRQSMNYGANPEYQIYVKKTPILIPLVPLHSLLGWSFIKI